MGRNVKQFRSFSPSHFYWIRSCFLPHLLKKLIYSPRNWPASIPRSHSTTGNRGISANTMVADMDGVSIDFMRWETKYGWYEGRNESLLYKYYPPWSKDNIIVKINHKFDAFPQRWDGFPGSHSVCMSRLLFIRLIIEISCVFSGVSTWNILEWGHDKSLVFFFYEPHPKSFLKTLNRYWRIFIDGSIGKRIEVLPRLRAMPS